MANYNFISTSATGSWNSAANWDLGTLPGAVDNVTFGALSGQVVTGTGSAATVTNNSGELFNGTFQFGYLSSGEITGGVTTVGGFGAATVDAGATFHTTGDANLNNLTINGGTAIVDGTFTAAATGNFQRLLNLVNGSVLKAHALSLTGSGVLSNSSIDSTSSVELGTGGSVQPGQLLIDADGSLVLDQPGAAVSVGTIVNHGVISTGNQTEIFTRDPVTGNSGSFTNSGSVNGNDGTVKIFAAQWNNSGHITNANLNADPDVNGNVAAIVNTGVIAVISNSTYTNIQVSIDGAVTGSGEIDIDSSAPGTTTELDLSGAIGAGQTIKFSGANSILQIQEGNTVAAAITGLVAGDLINLQGFSQQPTVSYSGGVLKVFDGATLELSLNVGAGLGTPLVSGDNNLGYDLNFISVPGQTFTLTSKIDHFTGGAGDDSFIATAQTLNKKDVLDGGGGSNTLVLKGSGQFNLSNPATLANIQSVTAVENVKGSLQNITLRDGLNLTVNVQDAARVPVLTGWNRISHSQDLVQAGAGNDTTGIQITGANDASVFNLGGGLDLITLGSVNETVNGGRGDALIEATSATAGALIHGAGAGVTVLDITGGGSMTMNAGDTNIDLVSLDNSTKAYNFTANGQSGLVIDDENNHGGDTIRAMGDHQTILGGAAGGGALTMVGWTGGNTTFQNSQSRFNGDVLVNFNAPGDVMDVTNLNSAKLKVQTFVENAAGTQGVLTLGDGGSTFSVTLVGQLAASGYHGSAAGAGFHFAADGLGGANVTWHH